MWLPERAGPVLRWLGLFSPEEMTERGLYQCLSGFAGRGQSMDQDLLSGAQQWHKRPWAETDAQEVPPEHEEEIHCAVTEHWNRSPREGVESLTGDTPEVSGCSPVPCALG